MILLVQQNLFYRVVIPPVLKQPETSACSGNELTFFLVESFVKNSLSEVATKQEKAFLDYLISQTRAALESFFCAFMWW